MSRAAIDVEFEFAVESAVDIKTLRQLVAATCREAGLNDAAIAIRIVDDAEMSEVNKQFLGKSGTTDVVSFDLSDAFERRRNFAIVVNAQMAQRQAKRRKHSPEAELALYITHGLLHQLGYDDLDGEQARRMHEMEDAILARHGFGRVFFNRETIKETD